MSSPLIEAKLLVENPGALEQHKVGIEAELSGSYDEAHESFAVALQILERVPPTLDSKVQSARITRDDGFTYVRNAIAVSDPSMLDQAHTVIGRSIEITTPFIKGLAFATTKRLSGYNQSPKKIRSEVLAEHGATLSLMGRIVTVKEVMAGVDVRSDSEVAQSARDAEPQHYAEAHKYLAKGNNGYYLVSNAIAGARQEQLNGHSEQMAVWLGRASVGLAWTAINDPSRLKGAVLTLGSRVRHLRSYQAAVRSVTTHP